MKRTGTGRRPPSHSVSAKSHRTEKAWHTNRLVSGARLSSRSSIFTKTAHFDAPSTRKLSWAGLLNDAMALSNESGRRFAAMMPIMLACIFSARAVILARR